MSPGLPGIGLGALSILSALAAPLVELARTASGPERRGQLGPRWEAVRARCGDHRRVRCHAMARLRARRRDRVSRIDSGGALALPSVLIGMSVGLLAALLAGAKGMELAVPIRSGHLPPVPVRAKLLPRRLLLQGAGVLVAAWFPLLGFGAAGLSTLSDGVVSRPGPAVERGAGADVAGAVSARKRSVDATGDEPVPEASVAPLADGSDGSSPASSSDGEGAGAVGPPSLPGTELVEQAPEQEAPEGDTGGTGRVPGTGGVAVSDTGGNGRVPTTGGAPPPPSSRSPFRTPARTSRPRTSSKGCGEASR